MPTVLKNDFYKLLMEEKWDWKDWARTRQYEDVKSRSLMMLPSEIALINDQVLGQYVPKYANGGDLFFNERAVGEGRSSAVDNL